MATSYTILKEIAQVAGSAAAVYTNASATTTYVVSVILHNTNTTTETVELWNVPDSTGSVGTAADANKFWKDDLAANETVIIDLGKLGLILEDENDTIQAATTTASKVTIQIFGRKDT